MSDMEMEQHAVRDARSPRAAAADPVATTAARRSGPLTSRADLIRLLGVTEPLTTPPASAVLGPPAAAPDGLVSRSLTLVRRGGEPVPCRYLTPPGEGPWPGAVAVHQHDGAFDLGKSEPAGSAGDATLAYGLAMARRGVATVVPDLAGFEDRRRTSDGTDLVVEQAEAERLVGAGTSLQAVHVQDVALCLTWLAGRPEVAGELGIIGHSLGGQVAFFTAACDERVRVCVISCGIGTLASFAAHGIRHNPAWYVPGLLAAGDSPAVARLAVGQRFLVVAGQRDQLFPMGGVRDVVADLPPGTELRLLESGHGLPTAEGEAATRWLAAALHRSAIDGQP